jgi:hypothetical protein
MVISFLFLKAVYVKKSKMSAIDLGEDKSIISR